MSVSRKKKIYDICVKYGQSTILRFQEELAEWED